jgi:hypothetical protein
MNSVCPGCKKPDIDKGVRPIRYGEKAWYFRGLCMKIRP